MADLKGELFKYRKHQRKSNKVVLELPSYFGFIDHDKLDFDKSLSFFDWSLNNRQVQIDFRGCKTANYQTLSLIILYAWRLKSNKCTVEFLTDNNENGASSIWRMMGAPGLFSVAFNVNQNFNSNHFKPVVALRNHDD